MVIEMKASPMAVLGGEFGTRFEARILAHGALVNLAAIRTKVGTTVLRPRHAQSGRTVRRDSKVYAAAVACMRAALA